MLSTFEEEEAVKAYIANLTLDDLPQIANEVFLPDFRVMNREKLFELAKNKLGELMSEDMKDPLGRIIKFSPNIGESIEEYVLHLICGDDRKDIENIIPERVFGVYVSRLTITNPLVILKQGKDKFGNIKKTDLYMAMYKDSRKNIVNDVAVIIGQDEVGSVVTSFVAGKTKDKKAALRELQTHVKHAEKILYSGLGHLGYSGLTGEMKNQQGVALSSPSVFDSIS